MTKISNITELRTLTGMGILECKKAIDEANGNFDEAVIILRKKMTKTDIVRMKRTTGEGCIESYIHIGAKVGVLVEVNCESDFVANTTEFKTLCKDLCLQIAAANPVYIDSAEIPLELIEKEKVILAAQLAGKPQSAINAIVEGRLSKYYSTVCLLKQPFVKDHSKTIGEVIAECIARLGENIVVKRFVRYQLGV